MSLKFKQIKLHAECGSVGVEPKPSVKLEPGLEPHSRVELPRMGNKSREPQRGKLLTATG